MDNLNNKTLKELEIIAKKMNADICLACNKTSDAKNNKEYLGNWASKARDLAKWTTNIAKVKAADKYANKTCNELLAIGKRIEATYMTAAANASTNAYTAYFAAYNAAVINAAEVDKAIQKAK